MFSMVISVFSEVISVISGNRVTRFILYILYYKVYDWSCSQVGHDLTDHVQSSPEQIKITASICKHILSEDGSPSCSGIDSSMQ